MEKASKKVIELTKHYRILIQNLTRVTSKTLSPEHSLQLRTQFLILWNSLFMALDETIAYYEKEQGRSQKDMEDRYRQQLEAQINEFELEYD